MQTRKRQDKGHYVEHRMKMEEDMIEGTESKYKENLLFGKGQKNEIIKI